MCDIILMICGFLQLEKQTRIASDAFATGKVAVEIVKILFECKVFVFALRYHLSPTPQSI